jgi:hypothetical protein
VASQSRLLFGVNIVVLAVVVLLLLQTWHLSARVDELQSAQSTNTDSATLTSVQELGDRIIGALGGKVPGGLLATGAPTLADLSDQIESVKSDVASQLSSVDDRLKSVDDSISNLDLRISEVGNDVSNVCAALSGC